MTFRGFSQSLFLVKNWSCQLEDFKCLEKGFICRNEKNNNQILCVVSQVVQVCTYIVFSKTILQDYNLSISIRTVNS